RAARLEPRIDDRSRRNACLSLARGSGGDTRPTASSWSTGHNKQCQESGTAGGSASGHCLPDQVSADGSTPRVRNMRPLVPPILLFGVLAPAVTPTRVVPCGSQSVATTGSPPPIGRYWMVPFSGSIPCASSTWYVGITREQMDASDMVLLELNPPITTITSGGSRSMSFTASCRS